MKGQILSYDPLAGEGAIAGDDGQRYGFRGTEWRSPTAQLRTGNSVDFEPSGSQALAIYATGPAPRAHPADEKSPIVAGLLALFLGGLGIHKFYLGYNGAGITLLVGTILSWILTIVIIGLLGLLAISVICLVEAIVYLTKSQDDFTRIYVEGNRPWF